MPPCGVRVGSFPSLVTWRLPGVRLGSWSFGRMWLIPDPLSSWLSARPSGETRGARVPPCGLPTDLGGKVTQHCSPSSGSRLRLFSRVVFHEGGGWSSDHRPTPREEPFCLSVYPILPRAGPALVAAYGQDRGSSASSRRVPGGWCILIGALGRSRNYCSRSVPLEDIGTTRLGRPDRVLRANRGLLPFQGHTSLNDAWRTVGGFVGETFREVCPSSPSSLERTNVRLDDSAKV